MRRIPALVVWLLVLSFGCSRSPDAANRARESGSGGSTPVGPAADSKSDSTPVIPPAPPVAPLDDALADVQAMSAAALPSDSFREDTAEPTETRPKLETTGKFGYELKMPGESPIPTPTVYRGKLYAGGGFNSREFYCFDAATGRCLWGVHLGDDGPSTAVPYDDTILFNTESCTIFALDVETGKLRWARWLGDPMMSAPAVADGRVYTAYPAAPEIPESAPDDPGKIPQSGDKKPSPRLAPVYNLACFDAKSGRLLWRRWLDGDCITAPVAIDGEVWAATLPGTLYRIRAAGGELAGAWHARATSAPSVTPQALFFTKRTDNAAQNERPAEAVAALDRQEVGIRFLALGRPAPYLDATVQAVSEGTRHADEFERKNGIPGGFGGGFFAVVDEVPAASNPATSNPAAKDAAPQNTAPKDTAKTDSAGKDSATKDAAEATAPETPAGSYSQPKTAGMAPPDALSGQQRLAAGNFGLGNVSTIQAYHGSRVVSVGERNYNCMGDELVCTAAANGRRLWSLELEGDLKKLGGHLAAPPVPADGDLFVALVIGDVLQVDAATGRVKTRYSIGSTLRFPPVVADGRIYVGTQDGRLVCRKIRGS